MCSFFLNIHPGVFEVADYESGAKFSKTKAGIQFVF